MIEKVELGLLVQQSKRSPFSVYFVDVLPDHFDWNVSIQYMLQVGVVLPVETPKNISMYYDENIKLIFDQTEYVSTHLWMLKNALCILLNLH